MDPRGGGPEGRLERNKFGGGKKGGSKTVVMGALGLLGQHTKTAEKNTKRMGRESGINEKKRV